MDVIRVQTEDFSIETEYSLCREKAGSMCGALAAFVGLVRDRVDSTDVHGLFLEHYPGMTEKSIQEIVDKARERWDIQHVTVIHRIGELVASSQIVLVVVASSHRPDAFAACEFIMDLLKTEAVFWKKEIRADKDVWIRSTKSDYERLSNWKSTTERSRSQG